MTTTEHEEAGYIREALHFIGLEWDNLEVKLVDEKVVTFEVKLKGYDYSITGAYEISNDPFNARTSVIMTVSLARHQYGQLVFDMLMMAEKAKHVNAERNSVAEVIMRFLIKQALRSKVPAGQIKALILKSVHFDQNLQEESLFAIAMSKSPRKN